MSKVLISFVGNGRPKKDQPDKSKREYESAKYRFNDSDKIFETTFVSDAIVRHYEIKQIILIGTARSMWEEVYRVFGERKGLDMNTEPYSTIWSELGDFGPKQTHKSDATIPHKQDVEEMIGNGSHIEIVKYGLNKEELQENTSKILSLESLLNNGDELYIDITHSFRSLPIYTINLLIYLENVSAKKLKISRILYGMFEAGREFDGVTPVVDITEIMTLNRWLMGAYAFKNFGQGYQIAELVSNDNVSKKLKSFSDSINLNYTSYIKSSFNQLQSAVNQCEEPLAVKILQPMIMDYNKKLGSSDNNTVSLRQYKLSVWHYNNKNYALSTICLVESIISFVCERVNYRVNNYNDRENAKIILGKDGKLENKEILKSMVNDLSRLIKIYDDAKDIRNNGAHLTGNKTHNEIETLRNGINDFGQFLR